LADLNVIAHIFILMIYNIELLFSSIVLHNIGETLYSFFLYNKTMTAVQNRNEKKI